jgi:hypothetical protein
MPRNSPRRRYCLAGHDTRKVGRYQSTHRCKACALGPRAAQMARSRKLRRLYGITPDQYDVMLLRQEGKCAICRRMPKTKRRLHVDHDHKTGRVRGLLCVWCNYRLLGRGLERPDMHEAAAAYLRSDFDGRKVAA